MADVLGASATAAPYAVTYLRISALGIPAVLMVMAATGVLRGLQDTRTPLYVAVAGFAANLGLNAGLVYGAGLGVAKLGLGHGDRPDRHGRRLCVRGGARSPPGAGLAPAGPRRDTRERQGRMGR